MENENYKEVDYYKYCNTCIHRLVVPTDDPCNECLTEPARLNTHKPLKWEEKK